jgi:hypothetical protein
MDQTVVWYGGLPKTHLNAAVTATSTCFSALHRLLRAGALNMFHGTVIKGGMMAPCVRMSKREAPGRNLESLKEADN